MSEPIAIEDRLPDDGQFIMEVWDKYEPLGQMTHWKPIPSGWTVPLEEDAEDIWYSL